MKWSKILWNNMKGFNSRRRKNMNQIAVNQKECNFLVVGVWKYLKCDVLKQKIFKNHTMWEFQILGNEREVFHKTLNVTNERSFLILHYTLNEFRLYNLKTYKKSV